MKYNIFLDDIRYPDYIKNELGDDYPNNWIISRDYFQFVEIVDSKFDDIGLISFDHDLSCYDKDGREWTGKDACDYLINKCISNNKMLPDWFVHTQNVSGRPNIISNILSYLKHIENKDYKFKYYNNGIVNNKVI